MILIAQLCSAGGSGHNGGACVLGCLIGSSPAHLLVSAQGWLRLVLFVVARRDQLLVDCRERQADDMDPRLVVC